MADGKLIDGIYMEDSDTGYGIGGINGMHHNVLGWDNTTVGMEIGRASCRERV